MPPVFTIGHSTRAIEELLALLAELLEQLAHALDLATVTVVEALLHEPAEGGVHVAVVDQVVGDLGQDGVGVEVEPDLRAVPPRVVEAAHAAHAMPVR